MTLLCFLAASLLGGAVAAPVLCIDADGHVATESSAERRCEDDDAGAAT